MDKRWQLLSPVSGVIGVVLVIDLVNQLSSGFLEIPDDIPFLSTSWNIYCLGSLGCIFFA